MDSLVEAGKHPRGSLFPPGQLDEFIHGVASGAVSDPELETWLRRVYEDGLDLAETVALTRAMAQSGSVVDLAEIAGPRADKHSTGGVGDKATLVVAPMVAACGVKVAKMSGGALGHTGGTLDKLLSIPGMRVFLSQDEFVRQVSEVGLAVVGQTLGLAPADKRIYEMRNRTATVGSVPLIVSSILSKKMAAGARSVVLDVKAGAGAFMKSVKEARSLAETLVIVGRELGLTCCALVTDMEAPLGTAVGNALEVKEAIATLAGGGPADLRDLSVELASEMLMLSGGAAQRRRARRMASDSLTDGSALRKFREWTAAQGATVDVAAHPDALPVAPLIHEVKAETAGWVRAIDAAAVGRAAHAAALRGAVNDPGADSDPGGGIVVCKKIGDRVDVGEALALVHHSDPQGLPPSLDFLEGAWTLVGRPVASRRLVRARVGSSGICG